MTRMAELEVERNTFLREVKRLQRDLHIARQQIERPPGPKITAGGEVEEGFRQVQALYEALTKDHEGLKRKVGLLPSSVHAGMPDTCVRWERDGARG